MGSPTSAERKYLSFLIKQCSHVDIIWSFSFARRHLKDQSARGIQFTQNSARTDLSYRFTLEHGRPFYFTRTTSCTTPWRDLSSSLEEILAEYTVTHTWRYRLAINQNWVRGHIMGGKSASFLEEGQAPAWVCSIRQSRPQGKWYRRNLQTSRPRPGQA